MKAATTTSTAPRPTIAISMGDPLGIGPEITSKSLCDNILRQSCGIVAFGSAAALEHVGPLVSLGPNVAVIPARAWFSDPVRPEVGGVVVVDFVEHESALRTANTPHDPPGPTRLGGKASWAFVEGAINAVNAGVADAIVTAPIAKASWHLAGHNEFPGHTELLADRFGAQRSAMMFVGPRLRVVLVTIHLPLARVAKELTMPRVREAIELAHEGCALLGIEHPRIAVCGLNPHAGEGGILGAEDDTVIAPAIAAARSESRVDAHGPIPGDTVFNAAAAGKYDCVVAMYHDQGLIPVKLLDGREAVNLTIGLPSAAPNRHGGWTIRTSPAHGTAFDIAGKGIADPTSMKAAIALAVRLAAVPNR